MPLKFITWPKILRKHDKSICKYAFISKKICNNNCKICIKKSKYSRKTLKLPIGFTTYISNKR